MKTRLILLAALGALSTASAQFDVNYSPSPYTLSSGFDGVTFVKGQSFTVGTSGLLARVDVVVRHNGFSAPVYWDLRGMDGAVPVSANAVALASGSMDALSLPASATFYSFDLTSFGIAVTTGQVLTFVLRGAEGNGNTVGGFFGTNVNAYLGGRAFMGTLSSGNVTWRTDYDQIDYGIRTVVVPEPATASLALAAAAALCVALRRKQRATARD